MLTGLLFVTTALSYAEATTMFPEAGGSSSFARHAFNEFVSFGAGWALMLDYIITIAISAFFVPNYLAAFWPMLKICRTTPSAASSSSSSSSPSTSWHQGGGAPQHLPRGPRPRHAGAARDPRLFVLLSPKILITQIHLGVAPTWTSSSTASDRHHRLHGHRDRLQHGRGGGRPGQRRAAADQPRARSRCSSSTSRSRWSASRR